MRPTAVSVLLLFQQDERNALKLHKVLMVEFHKFKFSNLVSLQIVEIPPSRGRSHQLGFSV